MQAPAKSANQFTNVHVGSSSVRSASCGCCPNMYMDHNDSLQALLQAQATQDSYQLELASQEPKGYCTSCAIVFLCYTALTWHATEDATQCALTVMTTHTLPSSEKSQLPREALLHTCLVSHGTLHPIPFKTLSILSASSRLSARATKAKASSLLLWLATTRRGRTSQHSTRTAAWVVLRRPRD